MTFASPHFRLSHRSQMTRRPTKIKPVPQGDNLYELGSMQTRMTRAQSGRIESKAAARGPSPPKQKVDTTSQRPHPPTVIRLLRLACVFLHKPIEPHTENALNRVLSQGIVMPSEPTEFHKILGIAPLALDWDLSKVSSPGSFERRRQTTPLEDSTCAE